MSEQRARRAVRSLARRCRYRASLASWRAARATPCNPRQTGATRHPAGPRSSREHRKTRRRAIAQKEVGSVHASGSRRHRSGWQPRPSRESADPTRWNGYCWKQASPWRSPFSSSGSRWAASGENRLGARMRRRATTLLDPRLAHHLLAGRPPRTAPGRDRALPDLEPRPQRDHPAAPRVEHPPERPVLHQLPRRHPPRDGDRPPRVLLARLGANRERPRP